jgi:hypothetical protein
MKVSSDPLDDLMHVPDPDPTFNESAYASYADPARRFGGFMRLGNRVHEGFAEVTVCVYLPDGRIAFWYTRAPITTNEVHDAGGLRFDVAQPGKEYIVEYEGPMVILDDPSQMEDPKHAFTSNPTTHGKIVLRTRPTAPLIHPWHESQFAKAHTEQNMLVDGIVTVGDLEFRLDNAYGVRDRSWGPRDWHHFKSHRWLTMSFGTDFGLVLFTTEVGDESEQVRGYVHFGPDTDPQEIIAAAIDTAYDSRTYAKTAHVHVVTAAGSAFDIDGEAWSTIPLRHRKDGTIARLTEGLATWHMGERDGVGLFEYFDQMIDGKLVGP